MGANMKGSGKRDFARAGDCNGLLRRCMRGSGARTIGMARECSEAQEEIWSSKAGGETE
jgi:hypothetical protein